jgi:hypothetical protein
MFEARRAYQYLAHQRKASASAGRT